MTTTLGNTNKNSGIFNVSNNKACGMSITHTEHFKIKTFNAYVKGSSSSYTYYIKFCIWNSDKTLKHNTSTPVQVFWADISGGSELYSLDVESQNILCLPNTTYYIGYVAYCSNGDVHQGYITKATEFINRLDSTNSYSSPQTYNPDERYQVWPAIYVEINDQNTVSKIFGVDVNRAYLLFKYEDNQSVLTYTPFVGNLRFVSNQLFIKPSLGWAIFNNGSTSDSQSNVVNTMDYITITSTGNATDFGDLSARRYTGSTSNNELGRGFVRGGQLSSGSGSSSGYVFSTTYAANAALWGSGTSYRYLAAFSNGVNDRFINGGGFIATYTDDIKYCSGYRLSTVDFGNLTVARAYLAGLSNSTNERGVFAGGGNPTVRNTIDYITINSAGNATDFGDLVSTTYKISGTSNGTNNRGVIIGNATYQIQYITINSAGNAADFGDLTVNRATPASTSNREDERGVIGGGIYSSTTYNTIDYITINSAGNASDFGDLTEARMAVGACSN